MNAVLLVLALGMQPQSAPKPAQQSTSEGGQPTTIPEMWDAWCARCHAKDGAGKIDEPTVTVVPMDFTDCRVTTPEADQDWERAVAKGGPGVGLSPQMPAFEDSLTPEQISGFVKHMRGFCTESGWPSGDANFPRPIITEKAFPEDEFLILPAISHEREVEFVGLYERRLGKRSMFEIAVPAISAPGSPRYNGLGDLELSFKHTIIAGHSASGTPHIVALGVEARMPNGNFEKGAGEGSLIFEPFVSAGTMLGDWYLQTQFKVEFPANRERADRAVLYNAYVGRDTSLSPQTWTIGAEFNGENHEFAITPQVRKGLTGTGALGAAIGATIPINERQERGVKWVGYLLWEYLEPWRARK